jgi:hypothetical protein
MADLSETELLEIEIAAAWEVFTDSDPKMSTEKIKELNPAFYRLLALAFSRGFVAGAASQIRSIDHERAADH